jgi:hypothetical protein
MEVIGFILVVDDRIVGIDTGILHTLSRSLTITQGMIGS